MFIQILLFFLFYFFIQEIIIILWSRKIQKKLKIKKHLYEKYLESLK